jgi:hypothetical protein
MDDSEKTELTPANDNPWYWLATAYGEQTGASIDQNLADKNRAAWNRWISRSYTTRECEILIHKGLSQSEIPAFAEHEKKAFYETVIARSGRKNVSIEFLPKPTDRSDFSKNHFEKNCAFKGYVFPQGVTFASATFSQEANFRGAIFLEDSYFSSATFTTFANFNSTTFVGAAVLNSVTIKQLGLFMSATFDDWASFKSSIFKDGVSFTSAKFGGETVFEAVVFNGPIYFDSAEFKALTRFNDAKFNSLSSFINAAFSSKTSFSGVHFPHFLPEFFGAAFHEGTRWDRAKWPRPPIDPSEAQMQVYAYERLKQEMEKLKKHEDEQFFFRKELRARRELHTWRSTYWWLNLLYEKLSNYGYGVVRPLVAFAVLFLVGFALLAIDPFGFAGKNLTKWNAAFTSLANMFGSLPLKTLAHYTTDEKFAYSAEIFAIFQTIAGAVLLFLFFLALRNRFRLR